MNKAALTGLFKIAKGLISPDMIREGAAALVKSAIEYKNQIIIDPEAGEQNTAGIIYEVNNQLYFAIIVLNADNQILRFENVQPLNTLIDNFIKNY